jgi:hypothetical protein
MRRTERVHKVGKRRGKRQVAIRGEALSSRPDRCYRFAMSCITVATVPWESEREGNAA